MGGGPKKINSTHPPFRSPKEKEKTMKLHPPPQQSPIIKTIKG